MFFSCLHPSSLTTFSRKVCAKELSKHLSDSLGMDLLSCQLIPGWPKSSFRFFCNTLWKTLQQNKGKAECSFLLKKTGRVNSLEPFGAYLLWKAEVLKFHELCWGMEASVHTVVCLRGRLKGSPEIYF